MEITYTIIGADGQQYGPATEEQIKGWISQGLILPDTKVLRSDVNSWMDAWQYVELGISAPAYQPTPGSAPQTTAAARPVVHVHTATTTEPAARPVQSAQTTASVDPALARRMMISARWFYWIAALSLVNAFVALSNANSSFVVGLGITQIISGVAIGMKAPVVGLVLDVVVSGVFALFGFLASKGQGWSFLVGMVLYALDGAIYFVFQDWMPVAFHAFVLYLIFLGWQANQKLQKALATR